MVAEKRKNLRRLWWAIPLGVVGLAIAAFVAWGLTPLGPTDTALSALESGDGVSVAQTSAGYEFAPTGVEATSALVFYPGGHVDARSYAPLARDLAAAGRLVIITPMPLSLAVLSPNAARRAIDSHPEVANWALGGHSLGGVMAAQFAGKNAEQVGGLLLLASYPSTDISSTRMVVADVVGSADGVLDWASWKAAQPLLPKATTVGTTIEGGNHAQFGDYGPQPGDNPASITAESQRRQTVTAASAMLDAAADEGK